MLPQNTLNLFWEVFMTGTIGVLFDHMCMCVCVCITPSEVIAWSYGKWCLMNNLRFTCFFSSLSSSLLQTDLFGFLNIPWMVIFLLGKKLATPWRSSSDCKTDFPEARALQLPSTPWTPEPWSLCLCNKQWIQWWETAWTSDAWRPHKECTSTACQASGTQEFHIRFWKTHGLLHVSIGFLYIWISWQLMLLTFHLLTSSLRSWSEWVPNVPLQIDYLLGLQPRWTAHLLPTSGSSGPSCPRKTTK